MTGYGCGTGTGSLIGGGGNADPEHGEALALHLGAVGGNRARIIFGMVTDGCCCCFFCGILTGNGCGTGIN